MNSLTKRQKEILDYITEYIKRLGYSPFYEEIKEKFGLSAYSTVHEHITALVDKGYLLRDEGKERGLSVPPKRKSWLTISLRGTIACGQPIEAIEENETVKVLREPALRGNIYALRAKGDSMINEGIFDDDILIVKNQTTPNNGDTVVAVIDDNEATLKKFYIEKDRIRLQPANPKYEPIYRREVDVRGILVKVIRNY